MGINRTGGCIKKIGKPRSGVQDVSQEEIGEKRAVTDRKREGSRWHRNAAGTEGGKRTTKPGRKKGGKRRSSLFPIWGSNP
jgi:hypothetical protein